MARAAIDDLTTAVRAAGATGSTRLISVRHDFPTEWASIGYVGLRRLTGSDNQTTA